MYNFSDHSYDSWKSFIGDLYASKTVHTIKPTNFLEEWWVNTVLSLGELNVLVAFYITMNILYLIGGVMFYYVDKSHLLAKYKIQREKYATLMDYKKCAQNLIQNYILIIFPLIYIVYPLSSVVGFSMALPLPSLFTFCWQFFFCVLVEDITHYWLHRFLHTPWLYKNIHKVHHTYAAPFGLTASFAHPLEVLILGIPTFLGPFILKTHYFTFFAWVLFRQLDAVVTHCGYDLPHPMDYSPWFLHYGGTKTHDFHHKTFIFNYSSRYYFMDKLFGTYRDPY